MSETEKLTEMLTPDPIEVPGKPTSADMVAVTSGGIEIQNLDELMKFSRMLVADGAAPKNWSAGQVAIAIQSGLQVGLGLLGGIQQGAVINGIFSWRGQAAVALIQNSGKCKRGSLEFGCRGEGDQRVGYARAWRVGYAAPVERTFSVSDARRAGLWTKSGPWHDYPDRQLAWRAVGFLARDIFPDVLGGFPLAEEAVDFEELEPQRSEEGARPELLSPPAHDPLMDAIEGKVVAPKNPIGENADDLSVETTGQSDGGTVVEAELVPEVTASPTEAEQPSLLEPEDKCRHGLVLSVQCVDCDDEEAAIAAEKAESWSR